MNDNITQASTNECTLLGYKSMCVSGLYLILNLLVNVFLVSVSFSWATFAMFEIL